MLNNSIAEKFEEIADMLEVLGDSNVFRLRAYRRGAEAVRGYSVDIASMGEEEIGKIPGIGKDLNSKIIEMKVTGACAMHAELMSKLSPGILQILKIRGVGPKKVKLFLEKLGIDSVSKLKAAAESGAIATLPGMGEKSEKAILESIQESTHLKERIPIKVALPEAEAYVEYMKSMKEVKKCEYAGSLRRRQETIGDIDILAIGSDSKKMSDYFLAYPKVKRVLVNGETKSSVVIEGEIQVDFRVIDESSFGATLYYFTGSKQHNIQTRTIAIKKNLKINEYGVFDGEKNIASKTEEDVFKAFGLPYIPPEIREDQGEIEAALNGKLPKLIVESDLIGDLHLNSISELKMDYGILARQFVDIGTLKKQAKEIEKSGLKILHGVKIDNIKMLNFDLAKIVLFSAISSTTDEIIHALQNPNVKILCDLNGKNDLEKIIRATKEFDKIIEVDGNYGRVCKNEGVKISVKCDKYGIFIARRDWIEAADVVNAKQYNDFIKFL